MNVVTLRDESLLQGDFYVPQFEIKIEGANLPRNVLRDVMQLTYKDNIKEIDGFELTVNNWDPDTQDFKYVGSETAERLARQTGDDRLLRLFEPCNKVVEVFMGYAGDLHLMVKGTFTTMEPNFPSGGASTLAVRGLNVLHQLRRKQYTTTWGTQIDSKIDKDSDIAENIATLMDKDSKPAQKRFPLPIVTDPEARKKEEPIPYVAQRNQHDIDFLLARAREHSYVVVIREGDPKKQGKERQQHLYFGPSDSKTPIRRDVTYVLEWNKSLIDFKPTLTTANQVRSVTVNGWNRATKKPISETVTLEQLDLNKDLHNLLQSCDPREERVVDEPVFTVAQAKTRAKAILLERHKETVKASATCIGLPDLRAGQRVQIAGLGSRFSGTYFVTDTTHTLNGSDYTTKFNARREDEG